LAAREATDIKTLAHGLQGLGELAKHRGNHERAEALLSEALAQWRALERRAVKLMESLWHGTMRNRVRFGSSVSRIPSTLVQPALGDRVEFASVLQSLGEVAHLRGQPLLAASRYAEAADLAQTVGTEVVAQGCENGLGLLALDQGDPAAAASHFLVAVRLDAIGPPSFMKQRETLTYLAALAVRGGRPDAAARLLGTAAAVSEAGGLGLWPTLRSREDAAATSARSALGPDAFAAAWNIGRALSPEVVLSEALALAEEMAATPAAEARLGATGAPHPV
jgi:hypothetical protein